MSLPDQSKRSLRGRIIALGIPGASAISPVGTFLPGGPIHDNPAFVAFTQAGRVLDPARILVGSRSNFGAPPANPDELQGSFLSFDPRDTDALVIPEAFAGNEGQASILEGRVQLYSAQRPAFLNAINTPKAVTAGFTSVSNPLGFSINNAFGRLWPANAPTGLYGIGTSTILDPNGAPLANATSLGAVTATSTNLGQNIFGHVSFRIKEVSGKDSNGNDFIEIVDECAWVLVNGTFISWECLCDDAAAAGSFNLINIGSDV